MVGLSLNQQALTDSLVRLSVIELVFDKVDGELIVDAIDDVVDNDVVANGEVVVDGEVAPGVTAIAADY